MLPLRANISNNREEKHRTAVGQSGDCVSPVIREVLGVGVEGPTSNLQPGAESALCRTDLMLKIGYDVTPLVGMCTGVGNYTRQLLAHMLAQEGEHDFLLLA